MAERNFAIEECLPTEAASWYRRSPDVYAGKTYLGRNLALEDDRKAEILKTLIAIFGLYSIINHEIINGGLAAIAEFVLHAREYLQQGESIYQTKILK